MPQLMFVSGPGSILIQMIVIRRYIEYLELSMAIIFFAKKILRPLMSVTLSDSGRKSHRLGFLGDFRSCPLPAIVRYNNAQTWHAITLYRFSNANITLASLNNFVFELKITCIDASKPLPFYHVLFYNTAF
jgi:hypothetical protein